jgi:hypothetical protein
MVPMEEINQYSLRFCFIAPRVFGLKFSSATHVDLYTKCTRGLPAKKALASIEYLDEYRV